MKKIGEYTCRGQVTADNLPFRIILDDGTFQTGYRIKKFVIAAFDIDNTNTRNLTAKLATTPDLTDAIDWNWQDQRELAWSMFSWDANGIFPQTFEQIDKDQLIIQDLFIYVDEPAGSTTQFCNYYIELEKYEITDWQGALAMTRDKSAGGD